MPDYAGLLENIKKSAVEAVNAGKPFSFVLGVVKTADPLSIEVDQRLTLRASQLMLTNNVRDYWVEMTVDHFTEYDAGGSGDAAYANHRHAYKGRKRFLVHLKLKAGEKVILQQVQGGQQYIVLDRVEAPK